MKAVIQRVLDANLKVEGKLISQIGQGYVIFLGIKNNDPKTNSDECSSLGRLVEVTGVEPVSKK